MQRPAKPWTPVRFRPPPPNALWKHREPLGTFRVTDPGNRLKGKVPGRILGIVTRSAYGPAPAHRSRGRSGEAAREGVLPQGWRWTTVPNRTERRQNLTAEVRRQQSNVHERTADHTDATYLCPAPRDPSKQITPEGIEKFYRNAPQLGDKHSPHSWRSAFPTICHESGKDGDVIEAQLDHVAGDKVAAAYDRARRLELRRELMQ